MWWILIVWHLIGITTAIAYVIDSYKSKLSLSLKDIFSILTWILIGPIIWLSIGLYSLVDFIQNHIDDDIIKFK